MGWVGGVLALSSPWILGGMSDSLQVRVLRGGSGCDLRQLRLRRRVSHHRRVPPLPLLPLCSAGDNCLLRRCVVDENAAIGNNVQIINKSGVQEADRSADSERLLLLGLLLGRCWGFSWCCQPLARILAAGTAAKSPGAGAAALLTPPLYHVCALLPLLQAAT